MKTFRLHIFCLLIPLALGLGCHAQERKISIYDEVRRSGVTNEWLLPLQRIKTLPKWIPGKEKAPVSLDQAVQIASKWIGKREFPGDDVSELGRMVNRIRIETFHVGYRAPEELDHVFFYIIEFEASRPFDYCSCVVLMDGTVLEPEAKSR